MGVAVITGASSGIGRATALELRKKGYEIVNIDMRREPKEGGEPTDKLVNGIFIYADLRKIEYVEKIINMLKDKKVDVLVSNAGFMYVTDDYTPEMFDNMFSVHVKFPYFLIIRMIKEKILKEQGVVIFISYEAGIYGDEDDIPYGSSKASQIGMMKGFVRKYGDKYRFVVIGVGVIDTWICGNPKDNPIPQKLIDRIALKRVGNPEEVAKLIAHVVENKFINGCVIEINGGRI
jgi:NAD(P)-dependent dehydrogenase (short-subunit alcohol dehydrogenase family)